MLERLSPRRACSADGAERARSGEVKAMDSRKDSICHLNQSAGSARTTPSVDSSPRAAGIHSLTLQQVVTETRCHRCNSTPSIHIPQRRFLAGRLHEPPDAAAAAPLLRSTALPAARAPLRNGARPRSPAGRSFCEFRELRWHSWMALSHPMGMTKDPSQRKQSLKGPRHSRQQLRRRTLRAS